MYVHSFILFIKNQIMKNNTAIAENISIRKTEPTGPYVVHDVCVLCLLLILCMASPLAATARVNERDAAYEKEELPRRAFIGVQLLNTTDSIAQLNEMNETIGVFVAGLAEGGDEMSAHC